MPRLLPLAALLPLLAAVVLAQPPMPKEQPKKLTPEEKKKLEANFNAANAVGTKLYEDGKTADAVATFEFGLTLGRRLYNPADFPDGHPDLVTAMGNLGTLHHEQGKWAAAEPLMKDALAMSKRLLKDRDHPDAAILMHNLGILHRAQGRWTDAERLLSDALAMRKRLFKDRDHPDVALSLNGLGALAKDLGKVPEAESLYDESLAMRKRLAKGRDHPDLPTTMANLAALLVEQGKWAEAEPLMKESLAMRKRLVKDRDHPDVALGLGGLGSLYQLQGEWATADRFLTDALAMSKRLFAGDHPDVALYLNNLGSLNQSRGEWATAEQFLTDALKMRQRLSHGQDHPGVSTTMSNLASLYLARGQAAAAERLFAEALTTRKRLLVTVTVTQSEQQQIGFRSSLRFFLDGWLIAGGEYRSASERYAEVLAWKGSAFARQSQLRAAALGDNDPALAKLFAERIDAARKFATLTAAVPTGEHRAAHGKAVKELAARTDEIDRELARTSEPFRKAKETAALTPDQLAKTLPVDAALVDYLEYKHWTPDPDRKGEWKREPRFLAFVVRNGKPVVEEELKASAPIENAVAAWRQAIERGAGIGRPDDPAAVLRKLVWEPVAKHLGDAKTVLISPDGALGRLPFAALPGSDPKKYLIEEMAIAVVPVPQLIPELLSAKPGTAKPSLLVVGGVDFDADTGIPTAGTDARAAVRGGSAGKWGALAGTSDEAKAVANAFAKQFPDGKTTSLTGTGATEAGVRESITGRRMLHFATHGFFAPPPPEPKEPTGLRAEMFDRNRAAGVHPGLQCGLVLAGANKPPKAGVDDGILTALEVAGLDLRGVELAVLSACETGLGKESGGEGVLGLQRAFQAAGARAVVSSLWKVPDQSTAALMGRFYQHLWADKQPAAEALRRAQLELLRNPDKVAGWAKAFRGATADDGGKVEATDGRLPPRAWAAFTLSGDWR